MNSNPTMSRAARLIALGVSLVALALLPGCNKAAPGVAPKPAVSVAPKTVVAPSSTNDMKEFVSVFEDLPPAQGKDPFFPMSHRRDPTMPTQETREHVDHTLVLKGIVGSVHRRIAVINNETMQTGEESLVRTPGGHVKVKCLEIGQDYVMIQIEGEPQTRKLVMEQKK
jgi:hypothetical protein